MSILFSTHCDAKQCRDSFQQPHSCDLSPLLCAVAFRSSFVCSLLLDLDPYSKNYPDGLCPLFYKQVAQEVAPKLTAIFSHLVKGSSFPACWILADVVSVPKISSSLYVGDYNPISFPPLLPKVFEKSVARKLSNYLESDSRLPPSQFSYRKNVAT